MTKVKNRLKFIFALFAVFLAAFSGGIFMLTGLSASAAAEEYNSQRYPASTKVGYYAEYTGTVERQRPEVKNEGKTTKFPKYGTLLYGEGSQTDKQGKEALSGENGQLLCDGLKGITGCTYDSMDGAGNLYLNGQQISGRKLYKHTAAADMYYGNVSDGEEAVVKRITYLSRRNGNLITGLYAPAGEVLSITMSKADFKKCGGLTVYVGQSVSDGSANIVARSKAFNRMPFIVNAIKLTAQTSTLVTNEENGTVTGYFGSFLGGPVYLKPAVGDARFTVTISGGVRYRHFILGYTTEKEFSDNAKSSAPYFDLEVWDRGVRHSGPLKYAEKYTYAQLYNAAVFWEKVASVSNQLPSYTGWDCGVDFIYDCASSAAETSPALNTTVKCPDLWLTDALDYNTIIKDGCHKLLGEYNRQFLSEWGFAGDGVANSSAATILSYSLFTDISSKRNVLEEREGLNGLDAYTSASRSLEILKADKKSDFAAQTAMHSSIVHSFGQDVFIKAAGYKYGRSNESWFRSLIDATKQDMTYYFTELCNIKLSEEALDWAASLNYPMFVPAACAYQVGGGYDFDGERFYFQTMTPYTIEYDTPFDIDFDEALELPRGFSYKIKRVTPPENGKIEKVNSHTYRYTPEPYNNDSAKKLSGKIYVRVGIVRDDNSFDAEDKILILEFKQRQTKPNLLERAVYTYSPENGYTDAEAAFSANYAGYESVKISDNPDLSDGFEYGNADVVLNESLSNAVIEVKGKIYTQADGKYRIGLRGKNNAALYLSTDGQNYELAAKLSGGENTQFSESAGTYKDLQLTRGQWVNFKCVLVADSEDSFVCIGRGKFEGNEVTLKPLTGAYRHNYFAETETFTSGHPYAGYDEDVDSVKGFTRVSPDNDIFGYTNGWSVKQAQSTFGHIYEGGENSSIEFSFYGTQFALYSASGDAYGTFEVYIDGDLADTVDLGGENKVAKLCYLSDSLTAGRHTVRVKGKSGNFNIDSVALKLKTDPAALPSPDLTPDSDSENEPYRKPNDIREDGQGAPDGDNTGLIAGIIIIVAEVIICAAVILLVWKKTHKK